MSTARLAFPLFLAGSIVSLLGGCEVPDAPGTGDDVAIDAGPLRPDADPTAPDADPTAPDANPTAPDANPTAPDAPPAVPDADPTAPDAEPPDDCDADGPIHPGAEEVIDGLDNDCDGLVDEQRVCAAGDAPFTTLSAAIAAAPTGATLMVCPGTYHERIAISGKQLHLLGTGGAGSTILDGDGAGTVVTISASTGAGVTLEGLTIRNGAAVAEGGGIRCDGSTLHLVSSTVASNTAPLAGGGLYATGCTLDLAASRFEFNDGGETGGGAMVVDSLGGLTASEFVSNTAVHGGGAAISESSLAVTGNLFRGNTALLQGGGLYVNSDGMYLDNVVDANHAGWTGGGVHVVLHAPTFQGNTISANTSDNDGGGIYLHQSDAVLISNHVHHNVTDDDGGGIRIFESSMEVYGNLIELNRANDAGAGIRVSHVPSLFVDNIVRNNQAGGTGGGFDMDNDASTVRGGEITGNTAGGSGGGIFCWLSPWTGAVIEDVLISGNRAWRGAGLFIDDNFTPVTLRNLRVLDNRGGQGGGMMVRASNYTLTNSVFAGNTATQKGGAIYAGVNSAWNEPICPCPPVAPVGTIAFVVFHGNSAPAGSALWTDVDHLTVESSILSDNAGTAVTVVAPAAPAGAPPGTVMPVTPPQWRYNDAFPATFVGMADPTGSDGNLATEPGFMSAAADDFALQAGSACIDAGNPTVSDADGSRADMGMFGGGQ